MWKTGDAMTEKTGKKRRIIIAGEILLVGMMISAAILSIPQWSGHAPLTDERSNDTPPVQHTVRFYNTDDKPLEEKAVVHGKPVQPPNLQMQNSIFKGWSKQLFSIEEDADVYPIVAAINNGTKNVFYANAVYADIFDSIHVPIQLAGNVDCSAFTLEIEYDGKLLSFDKAEQMTTGVRIEDNGDKLMLIYSGDRIAEPQTLAELSFTCRERGAWQTNLTLKAMELFTRRNGEAVYTDGVAYDVEIHLVDYK